MFRYKIVTRQWVTIVGGDLQALETMLKRDEAVIETYLTLMEEAESNRLEDLTELTLNTRDRPDVYLDIKRLFDMTHYEAQECLFAAIRISKRRYAGKADGMVSRVINQRRLRLEKNGMELKILPSGLTLLLAEPIVGELVSVQPFVEPGGTRVRVHLRTARVTTPFVTIGIDLGKKVSLVVLRAGGLRSLEQVVESKHCDDVVEALAMISRYEPRSCVIKVGMPGAEYRELLDELYFRLLEQGYNVKVVNESYTSVTCSACGERGFRAGRIFWCKCCDLRAHADENAAVNIARREYFSKQAMVQEAVVA